MLHQRQSLGALSVRIFAIIVAVAVAGISGTPGAMAATDPDAVVKAGSLWSLTSNSAHTAQSVRVSSDFTAPVAGTYVLDLEIWNSSRVKKYQKTATQTLAAGATGTLTFDVPLNTTAAGTYSVRQGVWTSGWGTKVAGVWWTGEFNVDPSRYVTPPATTTTTPATTTTTTTPTTTGGTPGSVPSTSWNLYSTVQKSVNAVDVTATYKAPSTVSGYFVYNVEVWGPDKIKKFQKTAKLSSAAGGTNTVSLSIPLGSFLNDGEYTVRQGVWTSDWATKLAGLSTTKYFTVSAREIASAPPVTSTTTAPTTTAPTTTTIKAPTTTAAPTTTIAPGTVWKFTSTNTKTVSGYLVSANFTAPDNAAGTYNINLEIWDAYAKKYQTTAKATVAGGQSNTLTYTVPLTASPGAYTVRQGVWTADWSKKVAGLSQTNNFQIAYPTSAAPKNADAGDPLSGATFYGPNKGAAAQAETWKTTRPADAAVMTSLANTATATWFGGNEPDVATAVQRAVDAAANANAVPVLVAYNITFRDCGNHSAGGAPTEAAYQQWLNAFAGAIGNRKAVVIIEPDALAQFCGDAELSALRMREIQAAVNTFSVLPEATVYLDGGHNNWIRPDVMAERLKTAGVEKIRGFAVNVAAYATNNDSVAYGNAISVALGGKKFVIDTSRNGLGSNGEWCNPLGRALGATPTSATSSEIVDAYLWVKTPGSSDGPCNGGPAAGVFWGQYALDMARRSGW